MVHRSQSCTKKRYWAASLFVARVQPGHFWVDLAAMSAASGHADTEGENNDEPSAAILQVTLLVSNGDRCFVLATCGSMYYVYIYIYLSNVLIVYRYSFLLLEFLASESQVR